MKEQWQGFKGSKWQDEVDVRDFIQNNYKPYNGDESFLEGPTESTNTLWEKLQKLQKEERAKGGVLDMETEVVSSLTAYGPGYLDKDLEKVVGLQTDKPLKRAFMPYGGIRMSEEACETYGYKPSEKLHEIFTKYHKTHNDAVFSAYTPEMRLARRNKIVTGLPDTYGRGRIVGDYRRVALYGIDYLISKETEGMGEVNVNLDNAKAGDEITISATPGDGYRIDKIIVTDKDGNVIKVSGNKFVMPNSNVIVKVIFTNSPLVNPKTGMISITFAVIAISVFAFFQYKYFKTKEMNL